MVAASPVRVSAQCTPADGSPVGQPGPDVIVGEIYGPVNSYGSAGGYYAYSAGTVSCNIGSEELLWVASNAQHPVIGQNLYRHRNGRFEQIGQSWLKQGFTALQQDACGCGCVSSGTGTRLGIGCSDPYSADLNGSQSPAALSSRLEVAEPHRGAFTYPPVLQPPVTDVTTRRLRVHASDIDPVMNDGARYFLEAQYVTPDDATAGNGYNNSSFRRVSFGANMSTYPMLFAGPTERQRPAIDAWRDLDPGVQLTHVFTGESPYPGRLIVGCHVIDELNGMFRYEYAVYNQNSTRAVRSFEIPAAVETTIQDIGFHDVEYHSGDGILGTDWTSSREPQAVTWHTDDEGQDPNANALHWGTTYNFWFRSTASPVNATVTLGYFRASPFDPSGEGTASTRGPGPVVVPRVQDVLCLNSVDGVAVSWSPGAYDQVELLRDGQHLAFVSGAEASYLDTTATPGEHTFSAIGLVGASYSSATTCSIEVPAVGEPRFEMTADDSMGDYYRATGVGTIVVPIRLREDPFGVDFPHATSGFSLALQNDPTLLSATNVQLGPQLAALNAGAGPAFIDTNLHAHGVVASINYSLLATEFLVATPSIELVRIEYETVPAAFMENDGGAVTSLTFVDGSLGGGAAENQIFVGIQGVPTGPAVGDAVVTLRPADGAFRRGDCNSDGQFDIGDAIVALSALFPGLGGTPVPTCLNACDANDDDTLDIADPIRLLGALFGEPSSALPSPLSCGLDPTHGTTDLGCRDDSSCP